jgi:membrane protein
MSELPPPPVPDGPLFKWLQANQGFDRFRRFLRKMRPWKDQDMNVYDVLRFFMLGLVNGSVSTRAAAISFRLFVAFFPAMLLLLSIVPFTPLETEEVLLSLEYFFPKQAIDLFEQTVTDLIDQRQGTLLSVGVVLLLYYASNSVNSILMGFGESPHVPGKPNWLLFRLLSVGLMLLLSVLLGVAVFLIGFAGDAAEWAEAQNLLSTVDIPFLMMARWMLSFALMYATVAILYNAGNRIKKRWEWFSIGATASTFLLILVTFAFSWFIGQFATYNSLYGSLGTLMITLLWLNFNSSILLLGFELNAAIHRVQRDAANVDKTNFETPTT